MSITYFDWLPSIRKAFVIPNKIHRTNLLASTYTLVQGISRWSARIEIKGLCLSLWVLNNGTMLTHTKNMLLNDTSTDVISSQNMFSWKCICKVASLLFCWRLIFMSGVQNGETFKMISEFLTTENFMKLKEIQMIRWYNSFREVISIFLKEVRRKYPNI